MTFTAAKHSGGCTLTNSYQACRDEPVLCRICAGQGFLCLRAAAASQFVHRQSCCSTSDVIVDTNDPRMTPAAYDHFVTVYMLICQVRSADAHGPMWWTKLPHVYLPFRLSQAASSNGQIGIDHGAFIVDISEDGPSQPCLLAFQVTIHPFPPG